MMVFQAYHVLETVQVVPDIVVFARAVSVPMGWDLHERLTNASDTLGAYPTISFYDRNGIIS